MKRPSSLFLTINEYVNFTAGIIGIFAFLTGIGSIPALLSLRYESDVSWFSSYIPLSVSIPVFVISFIGISTSYFIVLVKANVWLCRQGIVSSEEMWNNEEILQRPGDLFALISAVAFGCSVGYLVIRAFFGDNILAFLLMFFYVAWLGWSAYQVGKQVFELKDDGKRRRAQQNVDWSVAVEKAKTGLGRMYSIKTEAITIERWWPIKENKSIGMHVILPQKLVEDYFWTRHFVEVDGNGNILKNYRI